MPSGYKGTFTHGTTSSYQHCKCEVCHQAWNSYNRRHRKTPNGINRIRISNLKKYGLTPNDYEYKHGQQQGLCAVCQQPEVSHNQWGLMRLAVDHNHKTGDIRGLLCMRCNRALGLLGDSINRIESLLKYRQRYL